MERQKLWVNCIVIGYLIAFLNVPLDFGVQEELIEGLIVWAALMIKIGGIFIADKVCYL